MSNNTFKQIICDAASLTLHEKMTKLKDKIWLQNEKIRTLSKFGKSGIIFASKLFADTWCRKKTE